MTKLLHIGAMGALMCSACFLDVTTATNAGGANGHACGVSGSTIAFQNGVAPTPDYQGTLDTEIDETEGPLGEQESLDADGNCIIDCSAILLRWDVSCIAPGTVVTNAQIELEVKNGSPAIYSLFGVLVDWDELATWSSPWQYPGMDENAESSSWSFPGIDDNADYDPTPLGSLQQREPAQEQVSFGQGAALAMVQRWVDHPEENFGIVLLNYGSSDGLSIASSEALPTLEERPRLELTLQP